MFLDTLLHRFSIPEGQDERHLRELLMSLETKRILFDSRQALVFTEAGEVPMSIQETLRLPFDQFYMELLDPIKLPEGEPGREDLLRALALWPSRLAFQFEGRTYPLTQVAFFLTEGIEAKSYVWRGFNVHVPTGLPVTASKHTRTEVDPSVLPSDWPDDALIVANLERPTGYSGWWERTIAGYTQLLSWVLAYLMAKSVRIELQGSRRKLDLMTRHPDRFPRPWHIIKIEQQLGSYRSGEPVYHHRYRYDVIGHLRFNKHRIVLYDRVECSCGWTDHTVERQKVISHALTCRGKTTTQGETVREYKPTIEWVPPHQRGLAGTLFIPATWKAEGGKEISPEMKHYWRS